jgi:uncharacterized OB-fold protein
MSETYNKPLPKITPLTKPFWDAARESRLVVQTCTACGDTRFPPSPVCPKCLSPDQAWKDASGRGTLQSWIDFHRAYWDGYKDSLPYRVCLVRLEEGPLLVSNLVGDSDNAKLGAAVKVVFEPVTDAVTLPKFTLA